MLDVEEAIIMQHLTLPGGLSSATKKVRRRAIAVPSLDNDILCSVFSLLDFFDLARCSAVCKFWNEIITRSNLLQVLYHKSQQNSEGFSGGGTCSLRMYVEELAMNHHRTSLLNSPLQIHQWEGHSSGVDQCRMKMGFVLTGVGDQVMRLWSLESYKCIEEYSVRDKGSLIDFDFDESKVVGLVGTRICIWRRNGSKSVFTSREGTFPKGLCMRYFDPEAVVGCEDGTARVFDMYSRTCSRIVRMHPAAMTSIALSDDQLIISGSSIGRITLCSLASDDERVATLRKADSTGISTLCFNAASYQLFAGTTAGLASCWDLRMMRCIWERRVSPNVLYSVQHMRNDRSTLVVGGIDGVLRVLDQNTGEVVSSCIMESTSGRERVIGRRKGRRVMEKNIDMDKIPRDNRPPITCLAVGMKKVVTTHNGKFIRVWKFNQLGE